MAKPDLISFLVLWFPHSGGGWLNRGMLSRHSQIHMTEFFNPFLLLTTDQILHMVTTEQVHKHRSKTGLYSGFEIVRESVNYGRLEGSGCKTLTWSKCDFLNNNNKSFTIGFLSLIRKQISTCIVRACSKALKTMLLC